MTPATYAEEMSHDRFVDTLVQGRSDLRDKKVDLAQTSFAVARTIEPWDPRPLFEQGNASLVAKNYDRALLDLESVRERATNAGFASQAIFDVGAAREALGDAEGARAAFVAVQRVLPSELAARRLMQMPKSTCDADVDRRRVPGARARDWLALWKVLAADYLRNHEPLSLAPVTSEADARATLCASGCEGTGPWVVGIGSEERLFALVAPSGTGLVAFPRIGRALEGSCPSADAITIDANAGAAVRVHARRDAAERVFFKTNRLDHEMTCEDSLKSCAWRCEPEGWMEADAFYDLAAGARVLGVEQIGRAETSRAPQVGVVAKGTAILVKGAGCDMTIDL
jgi:hypothetical protein